MTNIPTEWVPKEKIYDLYSLRWQIELLFKIWKSWFRIHRCKSIKQERLECHLYGQLISILLCSSTMFKMRELLLRKKQKELSEYKAMYIIKDYFLLFHQALHKNTQELSKILLRLFNLLQRNGRKSHRYEKKTVFDILGVVYEVYHFCPSGSIAKNLKPVRVYLMCLLITSIKDNKKLRGKTAFCIKIYVKLMDVGCSQRDFAEDG